MKPIAVVSISGGKDSLATALVAIDTYGRDHVRLVHAWTGHEHPLTDSYVRDYLPSALGLPIEIVQADFSAQIERKRKFIEVEWTAQGVKKSRIDRALEFLHPTGNPFVDLCLWNGRFPSTKARFCTHELKRVPLDKYMMNVAKHGGGVELVESWQGIRRDESAARANALPRERHDLGWDIVRPIVDWTAEQTISYATERGIEQNPLYRAGMKRVGCMPCINCSKNEILQIAHRWPEEIERVAAWERLVSEVSKSGASTFLHPDFNYDGMTPEQIFEKTCIKQVVDWSKTSRGGKQFDLERIIPPDECSSIYGLCE